MKKKKGRRKGEEGGGGEEENKKNVNDDIREERPALSCILLNSQLKQWICFFPLPFFALKKFKNFISFFET